MKKILFAAFACVHLCGQAQTLIPKLGVAVTNIKRDPQVGDDETRTGLVVGLAYEAEINDMFAIQPELLFIQKGNRLETALSELRTTVNYLEIPVLAKLKFAADDFKLYVNAGPSLGLGLSAKDEGSALGFSGSREIDFGDQADELKMLDVGLQFGGGVGYEVGKGTLILDLRYGLGLSNLSNVNNWEHKNRAFAITLGYGFSF